MPGLSLAIRPQPAYFCCLLNFGSAAGADIGVGPLATYTGQKRSLVCLRFEG